MTNPGTTRREAPAPVVRRVQAQRQRRRPAVTELDLRTPAGRPLRY